MNSFMFGEDGTQGLYEDFLSNTSDANLEDIAKPMKRILSKEEVSEEEIQQFNKEMKDIIDTTAQNFADKAFETSKIRVDDTAEEKKSKVGFYVRICAYLKGIFNGILKTLKECFNAIYGSVKEAISNAYSNFCNYISEVKAYFYPRPKDQ